MVAARRNPLPDGRGSAEKTRALTVAARFKRSRLGSDGRGSVRTVAVRFARALLGRAPRAKRPRTGYNPSSTAAPPCVCGLRHMRTRSAAPFLFGRPETPALLLDQNGKTPVVRVSGWPAGATGGPRARVARLSGTTGWLASLRREGGPSLRDERRQETARCRDPAPTAQHGHWRASRQGRPAQWPSASLRALCGKLPAGQAASCTPRAKYPAKRRSDEATKPLRTAGFAGKERKTWLAAGSPRSSPLSP